MQKNSLLLAALLMLTATSLAQVVIKEKININPDLKIKQSQTSSDSLEIKAPIYLNYGGK